MPKTNDLKKGVRVQLANGWFGTVADNLKGNRRDVTVEGFFTETGSVYSHDIVLALIDGAWIAVEHTPAQVKMRRAVENMF